MITKYKFSALHRIIACLVIVCAAGCGLKGKYEEEVDLSVSAAGAKSIKVDTINGTIDVKAADVETVTVYAVKTVRAYSDKAAEEFASSVELIAEMVDEEVRIYAKHPKTTFDKSVTVMFEVECPPHLAATFHSVNGQVRADGMANGVEAGTTNGRVNILNSSGRIVAASTNGRIDAHLETLDADSTFGAVNGSVDVSVVNCQGDINVDTVNGSVKIKLPANFNGRVEGSTVNGRASCGLDFDAEVDQKKYFKGVVGDGDGPSIKLNAVNGSVKIEVLEVKEMMPV